MCTVSVIAIDGGYRLVTNRDVARTRSAALPPAWHDLPSGGRGLWPTDPDGGGTWVGVNGAGLTLCMLNRTMEPAPPDDPAWGSRGGLIPRLLEHATAHAGVEALRTDSALHCAPFRLLAVEGGPDGPRVVEAVYELGPVRVIEHAGGRAFAPVCLVSSGLGDSRVRARLPLFETMVARDPTAGAQDAFQRHVWADRPEVSCLMRRAEARTVSITTVEVRRGAGASMVYHPVPEGP